MLWKVKTHTLIKTCGLCGVLDDGICFFPKTKNVEKVMHDKIYEILQRSIHPEVWEHVKHLNSHL